jgi:galactosamine-6-phosphate isomerase
MRIQIDKDYAAMSARAADFIVAELKQRPDLLLCASAGGTPTGPYEQLAARYTRQPRLFKKMRVLQIDEWVGPPPSHPSTCRYDLQTKLLGPLHIDSSRFRGYKSDAANPRRESAAMSQWLAKNGPIDICILGLGLNGHIAMNEPGDQLTPQAHVSKLTPQSQKHSMLATLNPKPRHGLTLGMADILASRIILLLVNGPKKRSILKRTLEPKISTHLPASFLHLHPNVIVFCDRVAAAFIPSRSENRKSKIENL